MFVENHRYSGLILNSHQFTNFRSLRVLSPQSFAKGSVLVDESDFHLIKSTYYTETICHNPDTVPEQVFRPILHNGRSVYPYNLYVIDTSAKIQLTSENVIMILAPFVKVLRVLLGEIENSTKKLSARYFKPDISEIIRILREGKEHLHIIKIKLDTGFDKLSKEVVISGDNPIGSVIYSRLEDLTEPISVRLKYREKGPDEFRITADRYGNSFCNLRSKSTVHLVQPILAFLLDANINRSTSLNPLRRVKDEKVEE